MCIVDFMLVFIILGIMPCSVLKFTSEECAQFALLIIVMIF